MKFLRLAPALVAILAGLGTACGGSGDSISGGKNGEGGSPTTSSGGGKGGSTAGPTTTSDAASSSTASSGGGGAASSAATSSGGGGTGQGGSGGAGGSPFLTPIEHVIVIVKENHTFDNYFGSFPGAEGTSTFTLQDGTVLPVPLAPDSTGRDLCHEHSCALTDWNGGLMNGWENVADSDDNGDHLAWAQYDESTIPNYWAYARNFVLGDHFFANVLGPSFPGHMFPLAAQAGWAYDNPDTQLWAPFWGCDQDSYTRVATLDNGSCNSVDVFPCFNIPSIPTLLPSNLSWKFYGTNFYVFSEIWSMFDGIDPIRNGPEWSNVVLTDELTTDIQNHTLPNVVWLVNQDLNDEHPNIGGICNGENWTVSYINQIMQSDYWDKTAIIFTMDDFGGWYDHVPPPRQYGCDSTSPYGLGFRLPLLIISPYAKPGFVFSEVSEQASIPKFIETVFGLPALSTLDPAAQDGQANDLMGAFDFTQTPLAPLVLTERSCPIFP